MIHALSIWLLVTAFFGAGVFNAIGTRATVESFVRWGYPSWWHWVTGGLEILSAILIALPLGRDAGLVLGAIIIAVAVLTVLRANIRNLFRLACSSFSSRWRHFCLEAADIATRSINVRFWG